MTRSRINVSTIVILLYLTTYIQLAALAFTTNQQPSSMTTTPSFHICEALYSDLNQAADLMTDGFYPQLQNNPILRPIRYFMELDRLQNSITI